MSVPIGRRNLFAERKRAALGIVGVSVALVLVLALDGLFAGAMRQISRIIDTSSADVFVAQPGVRNLHMTYSALPADVLDDIRAIPGVATADPVLYDLDAVVGPDGQARQLSYVFGAQPGRLGGPERLTAGAQPGPGEIVLDEVAADRLDVSLGDRVEVFSTSWRVAGLTSGLTSMVNSVSYVRLEDFEQARGLSDAISFVFVTAESDAAQLADRIATTTGLSALTRETFSTQERRTVQDMSTDLMRIMSFAAFLIGLAVIALTLHGATLSRLREIGIMKALGARPRAIIGVVATQAAWTVAVALVLSVPITLALGWGAHRISGSISLAVELDSVGRAAIGAALLGALGAAAPLVKVSRIDPASVFREPT